MDVLQGSEAIFSPEKGSEAVSAKWKTFLKTRLWNSCDKPCQLHHIRAFNDPECHLLWVADELFYQENPALFRRVLQPISCPCPEEAALDPLRGTIPRPVRHRSRT